jgi:hypothetical protein
MTRRIVLASAGALGAIAALAVRRFAACINRVAGPDDDVAAAARYRHMIGEDLPPEVRLEQARRLSAGAPVRRVRRYPHGGLYLEDPT